MTQGYQAVVLDIEGTTTSISFVYDALFPFVRREVEAFLTASWDDAGVQADVDQIRQDTDALLGGEPAIPANEAGAEAVRAGVLASLRAQMDRDLKATGLKGLQGRIWRHGYTSGELLGHVFEDVPAALRSWEAAGVPVYIYSSGSVAAQKLLFGHSVAGDLRPLLSGYFDTTTGPKKVAASYTAIAKAIGRAPAEILFATDSLQEAVAAREAGMQTVLSVRPGNAQVPAHDFRVVKTLAGL